MKITNILSWALRYLATIILLQTLYFKFTGHVESVELFTKLGVEPWGRIGTGVIELITGILLLIPTMGFIGSFLSFGLMSGAILSHVTVLGIESHGDGGTLFTLAIIVFIISLILMYIHKNEGLKLYNKILKKN